MADRLRLVVDGHRLVPDRIGGLESAFRGVMDRLLREHAARIDTTLIVTPLNSGSFDDWRGAISTREVSADIDARYEQVLDGHDVLWCPFAELEPARPPIPAVVTIPDLQHRTFPQFLPIAELARRIRSTRRTIVGADRVLAISEFTKREIVAAYHVPDEHVVVTHLDCSDSLRAPRDQAAIENVRRKHRLPARFALFPANAWPHKNHAKLLEALSEYRRTFGTALDLVLTGVDDQATSSLATRIRALGLADHVWHLGFLPRDEMRHVLDAASLLVFVTLFEGFGIPVVEAMRRGVPVVASNTTSIPEIAGPHALLVDPSDAGAIAGALHEIVANPDAARARATSARQWVEQFSYSTAAERTVEVLDRAARGGRPRGPAIAANAEPRVFIVTPSFNQARFLRAAIDSVLAQDYSNLDYFVADGGSTDGSVEILESYGDRVRWVSGPDGGQASAINKAWRSTDAEIVAWLNSDDTYLDGAVRNGVRFLREHPECAMVYGRAWYTDVDGMQTSAYPVREQFDRSELAGNCFVCQPATLLWREVFDVIELPDPTLRFAMDYDLWLRLSDQFDVGFVDEYLATSRMYAENKTLGERDGVYREIMEVSRRHFGRVHPSWSTGYVDYKCRQIARRLFRVIPSPIQRRIYGWWWKLRQQPRPLEPFADGWVANSARVVVDTDDAGWFCLECESSAWPYRRPLEIRVMVGDREIARHQARERGEFRIEGCVPQRTLRPLELTLVSNRGFVPRSFGFSDDPRQVAFRLLATRAGRSKASSTP